MKSQKRDSTNSSTSAAHIEYVDYGDGTVRRSQTTTVPPDFVSRENQNNKSRRGGLILFCLVIILIIGIVIGVVYIKVIKNDTNNNNNSIDKANENLLNKHVRNVTKTNVTTTTVQSPASSPVVSNTGSDGTTDDSSATTEQACNGLVSLCTVPANEVYYATVHNAMSSIEDGVFIVPNHNKKLEGALEAGYRGINMDIGKCTDGIKFVHGTCVLAPRDVTETMTSILTFLYDNPNEVLLMPIQIQHDAEGGNITLNEINNLFESITGLKDMLYQHPNSNTTWPTLGQLIKQNTRIILMHYNALERCMDLDGSICPYGFHEWFQYSAETQFMFNELSTFTNNKTYSCQLTRGLTQPRSSSQFIGMNIFITIPNSDIATIMNNQTFIKRHINQCKQEYNYRTPNVLLVDFWDIGTVLDTVQQYNTELY